MIRTLSKSLMLKIVILGLSLVLCSSFIMQYFAYQSEKNAIEETIGATALDITNSVLNQIDVTRFEQLKDASDMEDEYYISLREELNNIKSYTGLKFLYTMRKTENGDYIYVVDGADMDDEDASLLGDVEEEMTDKMADSFNGNAGFEISENETWGKLVSAFIPIKDGQGKTIGMLGADFPADSAFENLKKSKDMMLMTAALIAILGIPVSGLFAYLIIRSLKQLQHKIKLVEGGNLTIKVDNQRGDEVGVLSRAFQTMLESMAAMIRSIRNYSGQIVEHVKNLNQNVNDSNEKTEEINIIINEIAQGANEQAENFDNVTNLMEQVHGEIKKLNLLFGALGEDSVKTKSASLDVTDVLKGSVKQINLVNDIVDNTADMVKNLETKFEEIRSFSDIVSEIAEQTDLLALNASIEAARAGEQGRGFGVVAEEIKKLAKQSNEASEQITGLIRKMQQDINESNTYIQSGVIQSRDGVKEITKVEDFLGHLSGEYDKLDVKIKNCTAALGNIELDSNHILSNIKVLNEISQNFSNHTQVTALAMDEQREIMADIRVKLSSVKEMVEELDFAASKFVVD